MSRYDALLLLVSGSLRSQVAMTVKTAVIQTFLKEYNLPFVPLNNGLQLQVLPSIVGLSRCKKHHYAAFIKDMGMLVVWEVMLDNPHPHPRD